MVLATSLAAQVSDTSIISNLNIHLADTFHWEVDTTEIPGIIYLVNEDTRTVHTLLGYQVVVYHSEYQIINGTKYSWPAYAREVLYYRYYHPKFYSTGDIMLTEPAKAEVNEVWYFIPKPTKE